MKRRIASLCFVLAVSVLSTSQTGCSKKAPEPSSTPGSTPTSQASPSASTDAGGAPLGASTPGTPSDQPGQAGSGGVPPGQAPGQPSDGQPAAGSSGTGSGGSAAGSGGGGAGGGGTAGGGTSTVAEATPPPRIFTLSAGKSLAVFTTSTISTKNNRSGDAFTATLARPIVDGDWVVAKKGATIEGVIVNSDPGGRVKGVASIAVKLTRLTLADGRKVELSTNSVTRRAHATKRKDAAKIGIGAGIGAAIGAIAGGGKGAAIGAAVGGGAGTATVLATRGDPATIAGESQLTFRLNAPIKVIRR